MNTQRKTCGFALAVVLALCAMGCGKVEWGPAQQARGQIMSLWHEPAHVDLELKMFTDGNGVTSWHPIPVSYPDQYGGSVVIAGESYDLDYSTAREAYVAGFRRGDNVTCEVRERFFVKDEKRTKLSVDVVRVWGAEVEASPAGTR